MKSRRIRIVGAVLWLLIPVAVWFSFQSRVARSQDEAAKSEPDGSPVSVSALPEFSLTAHTGETVTQEFLVGQPSVVGFVFTRCVTTCPAITLAMKNLRDDIGDADAHFLTITVDPKYDTQEILSNYAEVYQADPDNWLFARGSSADTFRLVNLGFGMYAEEMFGKDRRPGYEVVHTNSIVLLNDKGVPVRSFNATVDGDMAVLRRILTGRKKFPTPTIFAAAKPAVNDSAADKPADENKQATAAEKSLPAWLVRLPDVSASLNTLATVLLLLGYRFIRRKNVVAHKTCMLLAFVASIAFLVCYLAHHYGLYEYTGSGSRKFLGTGVIRPVYYAILLTHVVLAMLVPFLTSVTIFHGLKDNREKHRRIAKITFPIWLYVSVTGVVIYGLLYHWPTA